MGVKIIDTEKIAAENRRRDEEIVVIFMVIGWFALVLLYGLVV